jgi:hypothetical protein
MKFTVPRLKIGSQVEATVNECFADGDVLIDFRGDLMRVKNQTATRFLPGDQIHLRVLTLKPLSFQFVTKPPNFRHKIDVSI